MLLATIEQINRTNEYYHNWGALGFVGMVVVALFGGIWFVWKRDDSEIQKYLLQIKAKLSYLFEDFVVSEARILVGLVDKHLPDTLCETYKDEIGHSRFEHFCNLLKKIPEKEIDLSRGRYAEIFRELFCGIITTEVEQLLNSVGSKRQRDSLVRKSYSLEGLTSLKLSFIAHKTAMSEGLTKRYRWSRKWSLTFLVLSILAGLLFCFFTVWSKQKTSEPLGNLIISAFIILSILGVGGILPLALTEMTLKNTSQDYENDSNLEKAFQQWKDRRK